VCLIGLAGLGFTGEVLLNHLKEGDSWPLLADPQRLTELYFTDYRTLPHVFMPGRPQTMTFTVHNLEHAVTTYHYKLIARSNETTRERVVGDGAFTLRHDKSQTTRRTIIVPLLGKRMAVRVLLEYDGVIVGSTAPRRQQQSIHYWANIARLPVNGGDNERV
jgi:hypothetical protein